MDIAYIREWLDLKMRTGLYSDQFAEELLHASVNRTYNTFTILDELAVLEGTNFGRPSATPEHAMFKHWPLKGLWHKHHSQAAFISINLENYWRKKVNRNRYNVLVNSNLDPRIIAHELVFGAHQERTAAKNTKSDPRAGLTGEWIVYASINQRNYYLTLACHTDGDQEIYSRAKIAAKKFAELDQHFSNENGLTTSGRAK